MSLPRAPETMRLRLVVRGAVQGVGFRPFVFRLAKELGLNGWVNNSPQGVFIEVEGGRERLEQFLIRLQPEKPPRSFIQSLESSWLDAVGYKSFEIRESETAGAIQALVLPDIATCPDCLREIFDPANRRYRYPFTNCTNCGPRFTIIEGLPYDRANTSMRRFTMCPACQAEYENPTDRRFHAQPNACPKCGPQLEFWDRQGKALASRQEALEMAAQSLLDGRIVAVKGLGGFHLMALANDDAVVRRLRELKHREEKPFALMFPSLEMVKAVCEVNEFEERLLVSPESPIVLLRQLKKSSIQLSTQIAPRNPNLGVMLPYTPLHHLLMARVGVPVIATSGNLSDEPICIDEHEAVRRLAGIADAFLVHDRPIVRHVDDSIVRVLLGREMVMRRARGYAPLPVTLKKGISPTLAVGAHLKNSVALAVGEQAFISQHIGDLETAEAFNAFSRVIKDFERLYNAAPERIVADLHPDYLSTKYALETGLPLARVQHHFAHVLSCMAENELEPPVLGISWDGTGLGEDGTVWGGEFVGITDPSPQPSPHEMGRGSGVPSPQPSPHQMGRGSEDTSLRSTPETPHPPFGHLPPAGRGEGGMERLGHFRTFRLPGGDLAIREPRRVALGVLYELFGDEIFSGGSAGTLRPTGDGSVGGFALPEAAQRGRFALPFTPAEFTTLKTMLQRGLNSPVTSSAGRLFDAVASLVGLRQQVRFEGQGAMELEFAIGADEIPSAYPFAILEQKAATTKIVDWEPMIRGILSDVGQGKACSEISAKFHNTLVEIIVSFAKIAGFERVALSGGCFQNKYLTEHAVRRLREAGFRPYWHQRVPPNDGGICLGQIVAAERQGR